ncbi:universal stress protein [Streptomyces sp. NBC_01264]|uniref:universal stress protein n=1 Tax=Streptomyces sp. NBC_01264 TaxID=2903804 RepID=UPI0022514808|nr:universal stress protein [Streptomyces sp. NBC_01264]MCX4776223.1 universal stress protein [Streptomyces sp. NBC_01264]
MSRTVIAGLDGSPASLAAAEWAAREARRRRLPLKLLHAVEEWVPSYGYALQTAATPSPQYWGERIPREVAQELAERHPDLEITTEQVDGRPLTVLTAAAQGAELLVMGSRGLTAMAGFLVGSVSQAVLAHAERPVVVVRPGAWTDTAYLPIPVDSGPQEGAYRPVVLGLDLSRPCDELLDHAFDAASSRRAPLRVIHSWNMPPAFPFDMALLAAEVRDGTAAAAAAALGDALRPWRGKYPQVRIEEDCSVGQAAGHLIEASADASLVVVGRRIRRSGIGTHLGPVAHAVLHHSTAPVAVVPHP